MATDLIADKPDANRVKQVQRPERPIGVPPFIGQGFKTGNILRVQRALIAIFALWGLIVR